MAYVIPSFLAKNSPGFAKTMFKVAGYNKYGLYHDDLIGGYVNDNQPTVAEAYRRLLIDRPDLHDQRVYRSLRANQLKIAKQLLPEDQWTTYEEDTTKGRYLQPYLDQIAKEEQEKKEFFMNFD